MTEPIPIDKIKPNPYNLRGHVDSEKLTELYRSIEAKGLLQPIMVRPVTNKFGETFYEIVHGYRRYLACKDLYKSEIECVVKDITDTEMLLISLTENIQREDLTELEKGRALHLIKEKFKDDPEAFRDALEFFPNFKMDWWQVTGLPQKAIAHIVHKSQSWVSQCLKVYYMHQEHMEHMKVLTKKDHDYFEKFINTKPTLAKIIQSNISSKSPDLIKFMKFVEKHNMDQKQLKMMFKHLKSDEPIWAWKSTKSGSKKTLIMPSEKAKFKAKGYTFEIKLTKIDWNKLKRIEEEMDILQIAIPKKLKDKIEEARSKAYMFEIAVAPITDVKTPSLRKFALECLEHGLENWKEWITTT